MTSTGTMNWQTLRKTLDRILCWVIGLPLAWLVVTSVFSWQFSWSNTVFLSFYLTLYLVMAAVSVAVRTAESELPTITFWSVCVFPLIGMSRIVGQLMHSEYATGAAAPLGSTILTMILGTISLYLFMRWEQKKDLARDPEAAAKKVRYLTIRRPTSSWTADDVAWW